MSRSLCSVQKGSGSNSDIRFELFLFSQQFFAVCFLGGIHHHIAEISEKVFSFVVRGMVPRSTGAAWRGERMAQESAGSE